MHDANRHSMGVCTLLHNLNDTLIDLVNDASTHVYFDTTVCRRRTTKIAKLELSTKRDASAMQHAWDEYIRGCDMDNCEARLTIRMDILAAVVILANALLMGMQVENSEWNLLWLDSLFTFVFILEFILRAVVFTHVQDLYEDRRPWKGMLERNQIHKQQSTLTQSIPRPRVLEMKWASGDISMMCWSFS
eukprot:2196432-Amphidinium_carterae.1